MPALSALELVQIAGALAALLTALFTGYAAWVQWQQRRWIVRAEWQIDIYENNLQVTCAPRVGGEM